MLIQVSEAEMLLDDARRYVCKARAGGVSINEQATLSASVPLPLITYDLPLYVQRSPKP